MAAMTKQELTDLVSQLVRDCETYRDALSVDRIRAMEYYDGVMKDVPSDSNRSKVVSRDVRAAVKKVLPSLIRTVLGNDKVVEYEPVNQGDEAGAEQATDYINYIVFPESDGYDAVQDAAHDALKLRNGVIRWWYEKKQTVEVSSHTGLDEQALVQLIADDAVEVLEQSQSVEAIELPTGRVEQPVFNVKIRRTGERGSTRLAAVPLEEFLIHPDAISIDDSPITGINLRMRRSDLIAMGYDRAKVEGFTVAGDHDGDDEAFTRRRDVFGDGEATATALQEVEYYELYVKVDADDDGIAELRRLVFAGGTGPDNLLEDEEWDEVPFADLITERRPHQREGNSVTDDMAEIQRVKTVLLRQTLDNLYWQNNQQPIVQEGVIQNPESVLNPKFGQPIRVGQGVDVRGAVGYLQRATNSAFSDAVNYIRFTALGEVVFISGLFAPYIDTSSNGVGTNIKFGDDAWLGDSNIPDGFSVRGVSNWNNGWVRFGNGPNNLGVNGSVPDRLYWGGSFFVQSDGNMYLPMYGNYLGNILMGRDQWWQNVTGSRAYNTTYQNTTGKGIVVSIAGYNGSGNPMSFQVSTDGSNWVNVGQSVYDSTSGGPVQNHYPQGPYVVPHGSYYRLTGTGAPVVFFWSEMRN